MFCANERILELRYAFFKQKMHAISWGITKFAMFLDRKKNIYLTHRQTFMFGSLGSCYSSFLGGSSNLWAAGAMGYNFILYKMG
jgi:hypothetical protein